MKQSLIFTIAMLSLFSCQPADESLPSVKEKYEDYFPIGAAIGRKHLQSYDTLLLKKHFNSVTAENDMKPTNTIEAPGEYTFEAGDRIVAFAQKNDMLVRGHTLVWYNQTPDWFYQHENGETLSKEALLERMKSYIYTVLDHYRGQIYCWDVVNEVISDHDEKTYRDDIRWFEICGPDYIEKAFEYAHDADPTIELFYNDYDLINPKKRDKTYRVLKELLDKGVPIHGVGMQGHWTLEDVNRQLLTEAIDKFASLGLQVQITELDISVYPYYHNQDSLPQAIKPYTESLADSLAAKYGEVFEVFREKKDKLTGVTFWGVADNKTWLSSYFVKGRTDYPLLFNHEFEPKKSFYQVVNF